VANAVYQGADALMLSGETAAGDYPIEAASMIDRIITRVEKDPVWHQLIAAETPGFEDADTDALVAAARRAADATSTACLVAFTATGATARRMARERPLQAVLALTPNPRTAHRLTLVWGLEPRVAADPRNLDEMTDEAVEMAVALGLTKPGGRILVAAGTPFGAPGAANLLRFAHAPFRM
jgi:pyruvate kinase